MSRRCVLLAVPAVLLLLLLGAGSADELQLRLVNEFGTQGSGPGQLTPNINDLQVAPNGNLLVSNAGNFKIQTFTPAGAFVREFGSSGSGLGQFFQPYGIAIKKNGTTFVVDSGNGRVEVFNATGAYVREFAVPQLFYAGAGLSPGGKVLYLVDYQSGNIQRVSPAGVAMGVIGSHGTGNGQFLRPFGIAVGPAGNLYIADRDANRVTKISPAGAFLSQRGGPAPVRGRCAARYDVAIDPSLKFLVVADTGNRRLEEFSRPCDFVAASTASSGRRCRRSSPRRSRWTPLGRHLHLRPTANAPRIIRVRIVAAPPSSARRSTPAS